MNHNECSVSSLGESLSGLDYMRQGFFSKKCTDEVKRNIVEALDATSLSQENLISKPIIRSYDPALDN